MSTLADRLALAFDATTHTQAGLARAARVKQPSVWAWMNGETQHIRGLPLLRAAAYLGVNPLWLAAGEGPMRPPNAPLLASETLARYESRPPWPFPALSEREVCALPAEDKLRLEGALVATAAALGTLQKLRAA